MNWETVCLPKRWRGLGVSDLEMRNIALLLRWWWKAYNDHTALWTITIKMIRWKGRQVEGPNIWMITGSFFWRQLQQIKHLFHWSCRWAVGDGTRIAFWFDPWRGAPLADQVRLHGTIRYPSISLRDAWPRLDELLPEVAQPSPSLMFTSMPDELIWRWEGKGSYSAKSIYNIIMAGGKIEWRFTICWRSKIPPTVKIFANVMLHGKILTHDIMHKRGMHCARDCVLCDNCPSETALHLLFLCPYATTVWFTIEREFKCRIMKPGLTVQDVWDNSWEWMRCQQNMGKKKWAALFMCVCWHLWKQRNAVVFGERKLNPTFLAGRIKVEAELWNKYCWCGTRENRGVAKVQKPWV